LENIDTAALAINRHLDKGSKIAVLCDCDADGMTSAALLINYLRARAGDFKSELNIEYLLHDGKIHGLSDTQIMKRLRDIIKPDLLIIPDASGTQDQYNALVALGIDIVVLDHHEDMVKGNGNKVFVVNNHQSDRYLNKQLSGVGVVWQLCRWFDQCLGGEPIANNYLDLVAVGLVADVMSLASNETRFLIQEGLKPQNIKSAFLKQCAVDLAYSLGGSYNPTNVGFYIGPLFNAVLRVGDLKEKEILFRALLDTDATSLIPSGKRGESGKKVPLVTEALRQATNAKSRQKRRQDKLALLIDSVIAEDNLLEDKVIIIGIDDFDEDQRALSGLIANKLQDMYQRPIILAFNDGDGTYSGSCRAPDRIEAFENFKDQCNESGLFRYALGHQAAFGIQIDFENILEAKEYFNEKYANIDTSPTYHCDFIIDANDEYLYDIVYSLGEYKDIWGQGLSEPVIAIENVHVGPGKFVLLSTNKNPTLKFTLPNNVTAIKFRSSKEEFDSLCIFDEDPSRCIGYKTTLVGKCQLNTWNGKTTPQILVDNYEVKGLDYDF